MQLEQSPGQYPEERSQRGYVLYRPVGNVFDKYLGNMNWYPLACWAVLVPGYLEAGRVLHWGIHIQGSIARMSESLIKRRLRRR